MAAQLFASLLEGMCVFVLFFGGVGGGRCWGAPEIRFWDRRVLRLGFGDLGVWRFRLESGCFKTQGIECTRLAAVHCRGQT